MAIRYFKCHTLPYPSYDVRTSKPLTDSVSYSWTNGPNGQATPTATEISVRYQTATSAVTTVSIPLNINEYTVTLLGGSGKAIAMRLRRENSAGFGEFTDWKEGVLG